MAEINFVSGGGPEGGYVFLFFGAILIVIALVLGWPGISGSQRSLAPPVEKPIDMLLFCPNCGAQHIDAPDLSAGWKNPPHRSHLCAGCGTIFRPADVPTNGVEKIKTRGERDTPGPFPSAREAK